jgi:peptide-methionine (S)-S-oxide reductase
MEKAAFGAGCFWGVEVAFGQLKGVTKTSVGYMGGKTQNPTYKEVCTDTTGHAEVVQVEYDPAVVSYDALLNLFWTCHDPTQLNRQGPDHGTQYRSAIFTYSEAQKAAAEKSKKALQDSGKHKKPVVTTIEAAPAYYIAEDYHQKYLEKRGMASCHVPG